jgi:hypothetical protein
MASALLTGPFSGVVGVWEKMPMSRPCPRCAHGPRRLPANQVPPFHVGAPQAQRAADLAEAAAIQRFRADRDRPRGQRTAEI